MWYNVYKFSLSLGVLEMFVNLFVILKYIFYLCISEAIDLVTCNIFVILEASCTAVKIFPMAQLPVYKLV